MASEYFNFLSSPNIKLRGRRQKKGYSLYIDIFTDGNRFRENLKMVVSTINKKEFTREDRVIFKVASQIFAERNNEMYTSNLHKKTKVVLLEYFQDCCTRLRKVEDKSYWKWHSAHERYKDYIKEFRVNPNMFIDEFTPKNIEQFVYYLNKNLAHATAYTYFAVLRQLFNQAKKEDIILKSPFEKMNKKMAKPQDTKIYLTLDEVRAIDKTESDFEPVKNAFLFSCFTGLRFADVKALKWSNIIDKNGSIYLDFIQSKTSTKERFPLSRQAVKYLGARQNPQSRVFHLLELKHTNLRLKALVKNAGIDKKVTYHVSRHTFGTLALSSGVDIKTTKELMGHKDIRTTEIYAKVVDETKARGIEKLPEL